MIILYIYFGIMILIGLIVGAIKQPEFDYEWIIYIPAVIFWPITLLILIGTAPIMLGKWMRKIK